jgi:hypothetical protein
MDNLLKDHRYPCLVILLPTGSDMQNSPASEGGRYAGAAPRVTSHQLARAKRVFFRPACFTGAEGSLFTGRWPLVAGRFFPYTPIEVTPQ